ncbi:MAG: hypothetical protein Q4D16_17990 [Eubacteriales bacterium]|nr:hypothetical protein [Eubacteriales bacterium]
MDQYEIIDNGRVEVKDVCDAWDGAMMMYKEEGRESGLLEGRKSGIIEGRELGIKALILDNLEEGKGKETILTKLERRFSLSSEEAELYFSQFANDSLFPKI